MNSIHKKKSVEKFFLSSKITEEIVNTQKEKFVLAIKKWTETEPRSGFQVDSILMLKETE